MFWLPALLVLLLGCSANCLRDSDCQGSGVCEANACVLRVRGDAGAPRPIDPTPTSPTPDASVPTGGGAGGSGGASGAGGASGGSAGDNGGSGGAAGGGGSSGAGGSGGAGGAAGASGAAGAGGAGVDPTPDASTPTVPEDTLDAGGSGSVDGGS
jgi:hypothetical protein